MKARLNWWGKQWALEIYTAPVSSRVARSPQRPGFLVGWVGLAQASRFGQSLLLLLSSPLETSLSGPSTIGRLCPVQLQGAVFR
jgi:hypothetical protein